MLAGEPPFTGPNAQAVIARMLTENARPIHAVRPGVSEALDAVLAKALARVPADRYATVGEFSDALGATTSTGTTEAAPAAMRPQPRTARTVAHADFRRLHASACSSDSADCSPGVARTSIPTARRSPCCRSRTPVARTTRISPTASPTKCAASSRHPGPARHRAVERQSIPRHEEDRRRNRQRVGRRVHAHRHGALGGRRRRKEDRARDARVDSRQRTTRPSGSSRSTS